MNLPEQQEIGLQLILSEKVQKQSSREIYAAIMRQVVTSMLRAMSDLDTPRYFSAFKLEFKDYGENDADDPCMAACDECVPFDHDHDHDLQPHTHVEVRLSHCLKSDMDEYFEETQRLIGAERSA